MKIINADAVLAKIDKEREYLVARGQLGAEHILVKYCRDFIEDAPPVEPPKGEWIETDKLWEDNLSGGMGYDYGYYFACSRCKYEVIDKTKFCPDCGLDMRGKKNEE